MKAGGRAAVLSRSGRYGVLLATLVGVVVFGPPLADLEAGRLLLALLFAATLLSCGIAVGDSRVARGSVIALALVTVSVDASLALGQGTHVVLAISALRTVFLGFVTAAILLHIVREEDVSSDTILGGICVFLLIGLCFYSVFAAIEFVRPGSFERNGVAVSEFASSDPGASRYPVLIYYSFVALSTVGFGDITPTWSPPRALSAAEAVSGQLYLAIFVANLVGMRLAGRSAQGRRD